MVSLLIYLAEIGIHCVHLYVYIIRYFGHRAFNFGNAVSLIQFFCIFELCSRLLYFVAHVPRFQVKGLFVHAFELCLRILKRFSEKNCVFFKLEIRKKPIIFMFFRLYFCRKYFTVLSGIEFFFFFIYIGRHFVGLNFEVV